VTVTNTPDPALWPPAATFEPRRGRSLTQSRAVHEEQEWPGPGRDGKLRTARHGRDMVIPPLLQAAGIARQTTLFELSGGESALFGRQIDAALLGGLPMNDSTLS